MPRSSQQLGFLSQLHGIGDIHQRRCPVLPEALGKCARRSRSSLLITSVTLTHVLGYAYSCTRLCVLMYMGAHVRDFIFFTKQIHKFTKNTIPPTILLKYFAYLCTKLISMEEYLIISNANFLLRVASEQIAYVCSEGSYCNRAAQTITIKLTSASISIIYKIGKYKEKSTKDVDTSRMGVN